MASNKTLRSRVIRIEGNSAKQRKMYGKVNSKSHCGGDFLMLWQRWEQVTKLQVTSKSQVLTLKS